MDYRKLNVSIVKDYVTMPFMDQLLDRLVSKGWYCFLGGYLGYNDIFITFEDQEMTIFTCPYRILACKRVPFGICNATAIFQRCMMSIFSHMAKATIEVFIDEFLVLGDSFDACLKHLHDVLKWYEECHLVLNWEK